MTTHTPHPGATRFAAGIALLAVRSLHAELVLYPKPGLVSLVDNGSHDDMNAATFMRSLFSLRHYFRHICLAGMAGQPFAHLKQLGIAAEARMLRATGGINTHRGAIFSLGLICAAAGHARAQGLPLTPGSLRAALLIRWGAELDLHTVAQAALPTAAEASNGLRVAALYAASGAREEAALGLPSVFEVGLPALQAALARGAGQQSARVDAFFALMAHMSDTNVFHRGGPEGARTVRDSARRFLGLGGTAHPDWREHAVACHREFVRLRLSPGGAADLLAASCLAHSIALHVPADEAPDGLPRQPAAALIAAAPRQTAQRTKAAAP
jgi:triphosphoribosyl-dephospho-CoA synthase